MDRGGSYHEDMPDHVVDRFVLITEDEEEDTYDIEQSTKEEQHQSLTRQLGNKDVPDQEDTETHREKQTEFHLVRGGRVQVGASYNQGYKKQVGRCTTSTTYQQR